MIFNVGKELKKWEDRVIYDVKFKKDTKANLSRLDEIHLISLERFVTIAANSEALVYKIGRYYIEQGLIKNTDLTFLDGQIIEAYLKDDSAEWRKRERIDDFFQIFGEEYKNKWVLIPLMEFDITVGLAIYFISQFKKCMATGLIMYAEGPNNIVEIVSRKVEDRYFFEFPKKMYKRRARRLIDDEW